MLVTYIIGSIVAILISIHHTSSNKHSKCSPKCDSGSYYEKGFGARPGRRWCKCHTEVYDE